MNTQPQKLWEPKYAVIGVLTIALSVFILDFLPDIVVGQIRKRLSGEDAPEPQSLKVDASSDAERAVTNPYDIPTW